MPGTLYLVATPIGNLQDITLRALEVLRSVDVIACEDTRHTRKLLTHFRISNRTVSYHEHNEKERAEELIDKIMRGGSVAIVSDAGTPAIADPGFVIVQRAIESGIKMVVVPGATAFVGAVAASGLAVDAIFFGGFLPSKKGERVKRLEEIGDVPATLVFYEAPHRLAKSLKDCAEILGDREAAIARELTKIHEEFVRGKLVDLARQYSNEKVKGEIVLVIDRGPKTADSGRSDATDLAGRIQQLEGEGHERKAALKKAAKEYGMSKSEAYRLIESQKKGR